MYLFILPKQQAQRLLKRIKGVMKEQPLVIRRDLFKIQRQETKVAKWWAMIPVFKKSIWVPKASEESGTIVRTGHSRMQVS